MSLQICPKCLKENRYWRIYKEINKKHLPKGMSINCEFCNGEMKMKITKKTFLQKLVYGILWMTPAIIITYLAITCVISYLFAILLVTIFHFLAMYFIIKKMNYN